MPLAPGQGKYDIPACRLDGQYVQLEEAVDVDGQVREEWKKIEGKIIVSAITRLIARFAVGQGIQPRPARTASSGWSPHWARRPR